MSDFKINGFFPDKQGLYDPADEKDACGVGFVADMNNVRSRGTVTDALEILCRLKHRGAAGCDPTCGDGAGILCSIPHEFFVRQLEDVDTFELPEEGQYAVGLIFLPKDEDRKEVCKSGFASLLEKNGYAYHWRTVPVCSDILGLSSLESEPAMEQLFVAKPSNVNGTAFEFNLFHIRKLLKSKLKHPEDIYVCSLSCHTIIYKGRLTADQLQSYFYDLQEEDFTALLAMVHSRFSTNTFPSWERAQPLRYISHNGEINTLRGNRNWMHAREGNLKSTLHGDKLKDLFPVIEESGSDSTSLDNVLEFLTISGRPLEEAVMIAIPEAWENDDNMTPLKKNFYEFYSALMEPWDGPAFVTFTDGKRIGAILDRNGLRPGRFYVTKARRVILSSEVGVVDVPNAEVVQRGRLRPGHMLLVDCVRGCIVLDEEIKMTMASKHPFGRWLEEQRVNLDTLVPDTDVNEVFERIPNRDIVNQLKMFGYTTEAMEMLLGPMACTAYEALGSMGNDTPMACISTFPKNVFDYFRQLFAQVSNPPIDPIRERIVTSLKCPIGPAGNLLEVGPECAHRVFLNEPVLTPQQFKALKSLPKLIKWDVKVVDATFKVSDGRSGLLAALHRICDESVSLIEKGAKVIILSHRAAGLKRAPVMSALAVGAVHHYLIANNLRGKAGLVAEVGDAREVHHFCVLLGFGVDAVYPYVAYNAMLQMLTEGKLVEGLKETELVNNFQAAIRKGMTKVMAKMGVSTLQSYKGAQIFEGLGVHKDVIDFCFKGCVSRIGGATFDVFADDTLKFHTLGYPDRPTDLSADARNPGDYHYRSGSTAEIHLHDPNAIAHLQEACRTNDPNAFIKFREITNRIVERSTLRGLLKIKYNYCTPIDISLVEPAKDIVKRFVTGAMSYGSISRETHTTLAVAMNRIGAKSNTGEGGEEADRYIPKPNGDSMKSAIKQVASGRFGVTINYLTNAVEIQIKMAQGAKPGEGGELPSYKVKGAIAKTRQSVEGVGLISPPPHHDIYSIEDLAQLIFDLKNANPTARVSVKLVSNVGVGVIAAGVAKGKAEHILISGHEGGTGAARWTGIKYAGLPWELGIAEAHQTLTLNGLRDRVVLQTDGQLKTGLDIVKAALLGAEEYGFGTTSLITVGCIMMRKCHLNTCPVGIATQDPELRKKFEGQPEHLINFLFLVAEDVREIMAKMGVRTMAELIGRVDLLEQNKNITDMHAKLQNLDLSPLLHVARASDPTMEPALPVLSVKEETMRLGREELLGHVLDRKLVAQLQDAILSRTPTQLEMKINNRDRCVGGILSNTITQRYGEAGLPDNTCHVKFFGSAGQSFGAWLTKGVTFELEGDSNDFVGKGFSGGRLIVYPPKEAQYDASTNMIIGNICFYGATSGEAFVRGVAAERFCVRNSGLTAVVEGVGDHGCEYMTNGTVVILGEVGRNFGAGMSGGIAYVYNPNKTFESLCNMESLDLHPLQDQKDVDIVLKLLQRHADYTGSQRAQALLTLTEDQFKIHFVKVFPKEFKRALKEQEEARRKAALVENAETIKGFIHDMAAACDAKVEETPDSSKRRDTGEAMTDIEDIMGSNVIEQLARAVQSDEEAPVGDDRPTVVSNPQKRRGFMEYARGEAPYRKASERVKDFKELYTPTNNKVLKTQAARCMDCGIPFCHTTTSGCPLGNKIPEFNTLVHEERWKEALHRLLSTNNFPEFTGRVCPAPCEGACVLGIIDKPVTIKNIEVAIIDHAFEEGWIVPRPPLTRTGHKIAIIGSGPAGMAAADQLNRVGHEVTVYERSDRVGGLLMYGVPNMKLDKEEVVQRRVAIMTAEGINFETSVNVGVDIQLEQLKENNNAVVLATGSTTPRDLPISGRNLSGIHFAMKFLHQNTKSYLDSELEDGNFISAKGKNVIVIGGGDTGNDCIGTAVRHGAASVVNFELLPQPPNERAPDNPWPQWPKIFRIDYGHKEVATVHDDDPRHFRVLSKEFVGNENGEVTGIKTVKVKWQKVDGRWKFNEIEGSERLYKCDIVLLAMGFIGPEKAVADPLGVEYDNRGNFKADFGKFATNIPGVFAAGDCRRGQSLVVWGIAEGRQAAREVDRYLMGTTSLP